MLPLIHIVLTLMMVGIGVALNWLPPAWATAKQGHELRSPRKIMMSRIACLGLLVLGSVLAISSYRSSAAASDVRAELLRVTRESLTVTRAVEESRRASQEFDAWRLALQGHADRMRRVWTTLGAQLRAAESVFPKPGWNASQIDASGKDLATMLELIAMIFVSQAILAEQCTPLSGLDREETDGRIRAIQRNLGDAASSGNRDAFRTAVINGWIELRELAYKCEIVLVGAVDLYARYETRQFGAAGLEWVPRISEEELDRAAQLFSQSLPPS